MTRKKPSSSTNTSNTTLSPPTILVKLKSNRGDVVIAAGVHGEPSNISTSPSGSPATPYNPLLRRGTSLSQLKSDGEAQQTPLARGNNSYSPTQPLVSQTPPFTSVQQPAFLRLQQKGDAEAQQVTPNSRNGSQNSSQLYLFHANASNQNASATATATATATAAITTAKNIIQQPISENKTVVNTLFIAINLYLLNHADYQKQDMDCSICCFTFKSSKPKLVYDNISQLQKHLAPNIQNWQETDELLYSLAFSIKSTLAIHRQLKDAQEPDTELITPLNSALMTLKKALSDSPYKQKWKLVTQ